MAARLDSLTGIRGILVWFVVVAHLRPQLFHFFPSTRNASSFFTGFNAYVDIFFLISGFILAYNYFDRLQGLPAKATLKFLYLRAARIFPVHWVTLAPLVVWIVVARDQGWFVREQVHHLYHDLPAHFLLMQSWTVPNPTHWNFPTWSLSVEWLAYLAFPFLLLVMREKTPTWLLLLGSTVPLFLPGIMPGNFGPSAPASWGIYRVAAGFPAGMMLYLLYRRGWGADRDWNKMGLTAMGLVLVLPGLQEATGGSSLQTVPLLAILVYALALQPEGALTRITQSRFAMFWGEVSYSLYMVHAVVRMIMEGFLNEHTLAGASPLVHVGTIALMVVVMAAAGILLHRTVELPMYRRLHRAVHSRRSA